MNSSSFRLVAGAFALALGGPLDLPAATDGPTNVVLIVVDDLGWRDVGVYGSDFHQTPQIDRLAREGMRFDNAYAVCTVCSPSRAALLTGKSPTRLHVTDWIAGHVRPFAKLAVPEWTMRLAPAETTLAEALHRAGYVTAHLGKWHLGESEQDWPEHHGFDINLGGWKMGQPNGTKGGKAYFSPYANPRLADGPPGEYLTERLAREALQRDPSRSLETHRVPRRRSDRALQSRRRHRRAARSSCHRARALSRIAPGTRLVAPLRRRADAIAQSKLRPGPRRRISDRCARLTVAPFQPASFSMRFLLFSLVSVSLALSAIAGRVRYSELWGRAGEKWSPASRLPDFSFAGYHSGEDPLPDVPTVANVRDFGAKGDGEHDDTQAFKDAIAQAKSGAIFVPSGRYVITDILWITKPNLVLRGAGPDQTTLYCPKPLEQIKPNHGHTTEGIPTSNYSWSGGIVWVRGERETRAPRAITAEAKRGERVLTVAAADGVTVGQRVHLKITDAADRSLIDYLYAGDPGDTAKLTERGAITTTFVSRVTAIAGDRITLERPLPFDVRLAWQPTLSVFEPDVTEVGIEALSFEFPPTPYLGHFKESGFNAVAVNTAADCWVRDVRIVNADSGVYLSGTFCTLDGMLLESQRPMNAARQATGHHALQLGVDCLAQNFDFRTHFIHDITVDSDDCRNVIKNGRGVNLSLDHHKRVPYANLFCNLDAGDGSELWRCGGGAALGKHSAAWSTFWNVRTARPVRPPTDAFGPSLMNFVGLHTEEPSRLDPAGRWWEAIPPAELFPQDLHAAQLERRLENKRAAKIP